MLHSIRNMAFSEDEWTIIEKTPGTVFWYIANADGNFHKNELQTLRAYWKSHRRSYSDDARFDACIKAIWETSQPVKISASTVRKILGEFRKILKKHDELHTRNMRLALMDLAKDTAAAHKELFGDRVSAVEQKAIANVRAWL